MGLAVANSHLRRRYPRKHQAPIIKIAPATQMQKPDFSRKALLA
jgi:hypothetical protein